MILHVRPGIENTIRREVREENIAPGYDEDQLPVPEMDSFMEYPTLSSVHSMLPDEYSSFAPEIRLKHMKPVTADTMLIRHSNLRDESGRKLFFEISIRSGTDFVSTASHVRAVVNNESI